MKTLICVAVLALVASAIASPAFNRAAINSFDQLAEIEGFFSSLKRMGGNALKGALGSVLGGGRIQQDDSSDYNDNSDDSDGSLALLGALLDKMERDAEKKVMLQSLKDRANAEGFWSTVGKVGLSLLPEDQD